MGKVISRLSLQLLQNDISDTSQLPKLTRCKILLIIDICQLQKKMHKVYKILIKSFLFNVFKHSRSFKELTGFFRQMADYPYTKLKC